MTYITRGIGVIALGIAMLVAGPAVAQMQGGQTGQTGQIPSAAQSAQNFSHQQLQNFAEASGRIRDIRRSAIQRMQQVNSKQKRGQIRSRASHKMKMAIKDSGLTLKEYNRIARATQSNRQLAHRIKQMR